MTEGPFRWITPFQARIVAQLRMREHVAGQVVAASLGELAQELGRGITPGDVHSALVELWREDFFVGRPLVSEREFCGRLPG